jgi:Beta-lactamase enzyme family/Putative peptidoglycan binding domain
MMARQNLRKGVLQSILLILILAIVAGGVVGWISYRRARADYDAYRTRIQEGVKIAGVDVGWHTPAEARAKVWEWVAEPYYRNFALHYQDESLILSPGDNLGLDIPVDDMVAEAMAASHQYDYWEGFKRWIQDEAIPLDLDIPLRMAFDERAATGFLQGVAQTYDVKPVEPMVNVETATFFPGRPGHRLEIEPSATMINQKVPVPEQREVTLPVDIVEPDQSSARIESMLSTLVPVMERPPTPPSFYTATIPISTTGGIAGTPLVTYTGELTWTFPYLASYDGPLTSTTAFLFDPGKPGFTFQVDKAVRQVEMALRAGMTQPISFEPDLVPPPPITPGLLIPPLKARLAEFPGVTSILVKNLDTGEVIYNSNTDYVLSGMSIVKIGIMVEVYRHLGGKVDEQTHQELLAMLGSSSCNPCANRLLAMVGGGSAYEGGKRVTNTMRRLGLSNFYLCAPFRVEARWDDSMDEGQIIWTANTQSAANVRNWAFTNARWPTLSVPTAAQDSIAGLSGLQLSKASTGVWLAQAETPRYDRCVRATPREMANLVEMIHQCTQDDGLLREAYPNAFTPEACQQMIDIMAANDLRNMLGAGIPAEVKLAHKHGFAGYDAPWGDTRGEVGIVFSPGATWLISFYIWQDTPWIDWGINQPLYRDVSNMLYNYFNPGQPYWPPPPWAPEPVENTG